MKKHDLFHKLSVHVTESKQENKEAINHIEWIYFYFLLLPLNL